MSPKKLGKAFLCYFLERQVRRLRKKNDFMVIAVAGSIGKTSTKHAIAQTIGASLRVRYQDGNYNDRLTVPLIFFDQELPNLFNVVAWLKIWLHNQSVIRQTYPYDVVVVELGSDGPGQLKQFAYVAPELSVVTAVAPEHMEYFGTLDKVAEEELSVIKFSKQTLLGVDDIASDFLPKSAFLSASIQTTADYAVTARSGTDLQGQALSFSLPNAESFTVTTKLLGKQGAKIALFAAAAAQVVGLEPSQIAQGLQEVQPFPGRMQILAGIQDSTLIDDTYNASPVAVKAALDVLYAVHASQRIAILGSMNEMGELSSGLHRQVGGYCNPAFLEEVVTIGQEANEFLAPAAEAAGCKVRTFTSPYEAGEYVKSILKPGAIVLAKGSQNGVFAEEALKALLVNPDDAKKLVRQSAYWLGVKAKQFK